MTLPVDRQWLDKVFSEQEQRTIRRALADYNGKLTGIMIELEEDKRNARAMLDALEADGPRSPDRRKA